MKNVFVLLVFVLEFLVLSIFNEFKIVADLGLMVIFFTISFVLSGCYIYYDYLFEEVSNEIFTLKEIEILFIILTAVFFSQLKMSHLDIYNYKDFYLYLLFLLLAHLMGFITPILLRKRVLY